jgi:ATPase subunit of ABC transporter with duplicated ATPase domains
LEIEKSLISIFGVFMPNFETIPTKTLRIAVVGPCSAGKSSLTKTLKAAGYKARHPAQEHSYVPNMWQRITQPDLLIYLDVDYKHARLRRPHIDGGPERIAEQQHRLRHAREWCDFYLDTSGLRMEEVETAVFNFLATL